MNAALQPRTAAAPSLEAVIAFLTHEAELIDEGRFEDWLRLFLPECTYWLPLKPSQQSGKDMVSLIYDDRLLLETRVRRLAHPRFHAQKPPSRTCHLIGNVAIKEIDRASGEVLVRSNQIVAEHRRNKQNVYPGRCLHRLLPEGGSFRIRSKRFDMIGSEAELDGLTILF
jgi:3-phenylpropionate/cinnamic acid dioxygenase small subunit